MCDYWDSWGGNIQSLNDFSTLMRILALTDIHGAYETARRIVDLEQGCDVLVIGGDLTTFGTPQEAAAAIDGFLAFEKPVLVVAGNMDPPGLEETFVDLGVSLNGKGRVLGKTGFFGVSAAPISPLNTPYEISEAEIARLAEEGWHDVELAQRKVFVPHAPPFQTSTDRLSSGKHVGSTAVRAFIDLRQPDVVICGHIHEARGTEALGKSRIVNCGKGGSGFYSVIDIKEDVTIECRQYKGK